MGKLLPTDAKIRLRNNTPGDFDVGLHRIGKRQFLTVSHISDWRNELAFAVGELVEEADVQRMIDSANAYANRPKP